jgi:hypothetical protein
MMEVEQRFSASVIGIPYLFLVILVVKDLVGPGE